MNRENVEAYILAGAGLVRGIAEEVKSETTIERIETAGFLIGIGGIALAAYQVAKGYYK